MRVLVGLATLIVGLLGLYIGVSLIFSFFIRYGGCEVMSIPGLIFGTRYTVYCPLNVVDAVENAVIDREA